MQAFADHLIVPSSSMAINSQYTSSSCSWYESSKSTCTPFHHRTLPGHSRFSVRCQYTTGQTSLENSIIHNAHHILAGRSPCSNLDIEFVMSNVFCIWTQNLSCQMCFCISIQNSSCQIISLLGYRICHAKCVSAFRYRIHHVKSSLYWDKEFMSNAFLHLEIHIHMPNVLQLIQIQKLSPIISERMQIHPPKNSSTFWH